MNITGVYAVCAVLLTVVTAPAQARPHFPRYSPAACPIDVTASQRSIDCGILVVLEGGKRPDRTIAIPVAIVRAAHPTLPPVIFLHGGPGGRGIGSLIERLSKPGAIDMIARDQDWIFLDERGSGLSAPTLDCGMSPLTDAGPASDAAISALATCAQRHTAAGIDLSRYNARTVSEDVQALRHALGLETFDLYGISYGTRIALEMLRSAPAGIRAVVLDSPWPPEAKWAVGTPVAVSRTVRQILRLCARDMECERLYPQLEGKVDDMLRRWIAGQPPAGSSDLRPDDVAGFLLDATYDADSASQLPQNVARMSSGDFAHVRAFMASMGGSSEGQALAHLCKEQFPFESRAETIAAAAGDPIAEASARSAVRYFEACKSYAVGPIDRQAAKPVSSDIPVLLLAAGIDAGCPSDLSVAAARHLSHGQVVIVPDVTHGVSANSACARRMVGSFLHQPFAKVDRSCLKGQAGLSFTSPTPLGAK